MTLEVDPAALRRYAGELASNLEAARLAREYVQRYGEMKWYTEGLLATARFVHEPFLQSLTAILDHLRELLERSQAELQLAAGWYEGTDTVAATRVDESYPDVARSFATPS